MGGLWEKITSPFKKPIKKVGEFFAPVPDKVRVRDVVRETPKATLDVLQDMGQASWRGFASVASLLTGKPFVPEGEFQKELFGTDKPITITSFGREARGADPEGKSEGVFKVIDPTLGLFFGAADAIPGGSGAKQGIKQTTKGAKNAVQAAGDTAPKVFKGFADLTTKVLESLKGKAKVSKQFISDLTKQSELKKAERELLRNVLNDMPDDVPVQEFANQVKTRLLPLKATETADFGDTGGALFNAREFGEFVNEGVNPPRYSHITLQDNERGKIGGYFERIYESPVKNSAGNMHFGRLSEGGAEYPNYFAHARIEDLPDKQTRRIIEIQSDLFQKDRIDREAPFFKSAEQARESVMHGQSFPRGEKVEYKGKQYVIEGHNPTAKMTVIKRISRNGNAYGPSVDVPDAEFKEVYEKYADKLSKEVGGRLDELKQLEPYRNTWWQRVIREEIKAAAKAGKTKLRFPTGATAMEIEGLARADGGTTWWRTAGTTHDMTDEAATITNLREGDVIARDQDATRWRVALVNDEMGEFAAIPEEKYQEILRRDYGGDEKKLYAQMKEEGWNLEELTNETELFQIGGAHENNPIFRFYEGDVRQYLKKFGGKVVKDENGVSWVEISVPKGAGKAPVEAFGAVGGISETEDEDGKKKLDFDPWKAALSIGIIGGIKGMKGSGPDGLPKKQVPKSQKPMSEIESFELLAQHADQSRFALKPSAVEEEKLVSNLESIFADLKGVQVDDLKTSFTAEDLEQARVHYEIAVEMVMDNPARQLAKYANKRTGELPEVTGTGNSIFGRKGDSIITELGFEDSEQAREAYQAYLKQKGELTRVQANLGAIRAQIRLAKQRDLFVGQAKNVIARQVAKDVKSLKNLVESAERAGYRRGLTEGSQKLQNMIKRLKDRRSKINAIKHAFNLTDGQMRKIRGNADPRFMDAKEFDTWFGELETKAIAEKRWQDEKIIIDAIVKEKELNKIDNLRLALQLPPIKEMSLEQLFQFDEAISQFKFGDTFLGPRMIQTIANTDIGPVKTVREIRESLAKQVGVSNLELTNVAGKWGDKFLYDPALAEENPLYKYMVTAWTAKKIEADQKVMLIKKRIDELAFAARKSRKRNLSDMLVPQDKLVFDYLETPSEEKHFMLQRMTGKEIEFAEFVEGLFRGYRNILLEKGTLKRYRKDYITHTSRSFFERWKDDGFVSAIKTYWESLTEQRVDFEAIGDTGEVLGLEKFFKYALQREGGMVPSKNVARAVMTYVRTFEKKQALDQIIPKVDAYTFSLQRNTKIKDPTGLNVDGRLRRFVREWLNNKKGRRIEFVVSQGGKMDARLRAFKLFLSIKDLGFNIITGTASAGGAAISNYVGLTTRAYGKGIRRALTRRGKVLAVKYNGVVGEPTFENVISASNDVGDTFLAGAFGILQDVAYRAKRQFFLGSLTAEEWKTGNVTAERLAQIKLNMAKFHPLDDTRSVLGSTPEAQFVTMYKSWAVPFLMTARTNAKKTIRAFKEAEGLKEKAATLKTEEARQLMKLTIGAMGIYTFFHTVFEDDDANDGSFVSKLKQRFVRETASSLSALNPTTWLSIRPLEFAQELAEGIDLLIKLEEYKTSGKDYQKGDLKGLNVFQREFTPAVLRQFMDSPTVGELLNGQSSGKKNSGGSNQRMTADQLLELSR